MKVKNLHIIQEVIANISRFILAAAFIFSGFVKAVDPLGFQYKIQDYLVAFGMASWFPSFFPLLGGIALSAIEFSIGIFLFFGVRRTVASTLALMLMSFKAMGGSVTIPGEGSAEAHSSGSLSAMMGCNCLVELPAGSGPVAPGEEVEVLFFVQ